LSKFVIPVESSATNSGVSQVATSFAGY